MTHPTEQIWLNPPPDGKRFAAAFVVGLALELAALLLLIPIMTHQEAPSDTPAPIKLSIVAAPAPKPPPTPPMPKITPPPKPVTPPPPVPPPPPLPVAPPLPPPPPAVRPAQHVRHYVKPVVRQPPPPVTPPPLDETPPTPPPPPAPPVPTGGQVDAFAAAIKRALQAHANEVYPQAAQLAHQTGEPSLTFTYLDGVVTGISLARSSGFPLLDQAALEDARITQYPPPPSGFAGREYHVTVAITFRLAAESVDGD